MHITKDFCNLLDIVISEKRLSKLFIDCLDSIIKSYEKYPKHFTDMVLEVHNVVYEFAGNFLYQNPESDIYAEYLDKHSLGELLLIKSEYKEIWENNVYSNEQWLQITNNKIIVNENFFQKMLNYFKGRN